MVGVELQSQVMQSIPDELNTSRCSMFTSDCPNKIRKYVTADVQPERMVKPKLRLEKFIFYPSSWYMHWILYCENQSRFDRKMN